MKIKKTYNYKTRQAENNIDDANHMDILKN